MSHTAWSYQPPDNKTPQGLKAMMRGSPRCQSKESSGRNVTMRSHTPVKSKCTTKIAILPKFLLRLEVEMEKGDHSNDDVVDIFIFDSLQTMHKPSTKRWEGITSSFFLVFRCIVPSISRFSRSFSVSSSCENTLNPSTHPISTFPNPYYTTSISDAANAATPQRYICKKEAYLVIPVPKRKMQEEHKVQTTAPKTTQLISFHHISSRHTLLLQPHFTEHPP